MDHIEELRHHIRRHLAVVLLIENACLIGLWWAGSALTDWPSWLWAILSLIISAIGITSITLRSSNFIVQPMRAIWQAIVHLSPTEHKTLAAPEVEQLRLGRELVTSLTAQVYQLANLAEHATKSKSEQEVGQNFIANNLPLPCIVLDPTETIIFANLAAAEYLGQASADLVGKNVYMVLDMSFPSEDTFDNWLKGVKTTSVTASSSWERVRLNVRDNHPTLHFDLAAYYNKDNPQKTETLMVLFDHTKQYSQDDQAVSFIALSVHELRTPLTLLRGYIEVFDEELAGKLSPELQDFMLKMRAMAEQLTAFVNNILNVARIDDDQLELHLEEETWPTIVTKAIENLSLRAKIRGITLECNIAPDLPTVGVDRLSIHEVINNLVDNAIKYSGGSKTIKIDAHMTTDGLVETTVQDFGLGISTSILPNLFTKFYRDHRNRAQIGGTGLGLYLSKAIVTAHGGNLWVRSHEGQGSIFGFTLMPYTQLAKELKDSGNKQITRGAHGWIKNHSLYRR